MTKLRVPVGIPTLRCYDKLLRLCESLLNDEHECIEADVFILDNGGSFTDSPFAQELRNVKHPNFTIAVAPFNFGVSMSWNYFLSHLGKCIVANDDVVFSLADVAKFLEAANESPETVIFETNHPVGGFSTFYVNRPDVWQEMGSFDELYSPAYFEDNDCRYRLQLTGNPVVKVDLPGWSHDNSSTLQSGSNEYRRTHWSCFERNKRYYKMKWGGLPGAETFSIPFQNIHGSP